MNEVLFISTYDAFGGAAKASLRIFRSLKPFRISCKMFTAIKSSEHENVHQLISLDTEAKLRYVHELLTTLRALQSNQTKTLQSYGQASAGIVDKINEDSAPLVHLHWICNYLSIDDIAKIQKPIIWTLHDMWPFSGSEHIDLNQESYIFQHATDETQISMLSLETFIHKQRTWGNQNFTIVAPSSWLANCAKNSKLFKHCDVHVIPIPIDANIWRPQDRVQAFGKFNFIPQKRQILFIAQNLTNDPNKGWDLLQTSLMEVYYNQKVEFELILVGHTGTFNHELPFEVHSLGFVHDEEQLVNLYGAVHLLVVPSRLEAFSQVTCEAHACGLPVVAYDIGGVPDIISHQQSGWLAKPYDTTDFAAGIEWVLENEVRRVDLGAFGRQKVLANFSTEVVAEKYMSLYDSIVQREALK